MLVVDNYGSPSGKNTPYLAQQMHFENISCSVQYIRKFNRGHLYNVILPSLLKNPKEHTSRNEPKLLQMFLQVLTLDSNSVSFIYVYAIDKLELHLSVGLAVVDEERVE